MSNNLARAREAGQAWLERERPMSVAALPKRRLDDQLEAFEAGAIWAEGRCGEIHREEQDLWGARSQALRDAIRSASLIEDGTGWLKVHGLDNATPLFEILQAAYVAANRAPGDDGVPDEETPEAPAEWFGAARWRTDGVADLAAFRITTGDPRFDPAGPVTINGFLYVPAKENDHG